MKIDVASTVRKKGFFEDGSKVLCAVCGENSFEESGIIICTNCGNSSGTEQLLLSKHKRNDRKRG